MEIVLSIWVFAGAFHRLGGVRFRAYANSVIGAGIVSLECRGIGHADASYSAERVDDGRDSLFCFNFS